MGSCYSHWLQTTTPTHIGTVSVTQSTQQRSQATAVGGTSTTTSRNYPTATTTTAQNPKQHQPSSKNSSGDSGFRSNATTEELLKSAPGALKEGEEEEGEDMRIDSSNQPVTGYPPSRVQRLSTSSADGALYSSELVSAVTY